MTKKLWTVFEYDDFFFPISFPTVGTIFKNHLIFTVTIILKTKKIHLELETED